MVLQTAKAGDTAKTAKRAAKAARAEKQAPAQASAASKGRQSSARKQGAANPAERYNLIATAAYYRAEQRAFNGGDERSDWLAAEADIEALFHS